MDPRPTPAASPAASREATADTFPVDQRVALRDREPEALALFYDSYFDRVYGFVRRMVGSEHLAEDLTQDILMHIIEHLGSYDPERALRPWVFTIATNKVRDFWRSRRHRDAQREKSVEIEGSLDHFAERDDRPESELVQHEMDVQVREAIDKLPDGMRTTVLLRAYEGLSFEAIGEILDRNEVAIRKRYSRALETLRETLGPAYRVHQEES